jgi:16S rRNA (guanine527-N7)-methyltransferase
MELIKKYFPKLQDQQYQKLSELKSLYAKWNEKINVVSRKSLEEFNVIHLLHSLALAQFVQFRENSVVMDIGSGGGFPGIPLAILFPTVEFRLVDSIAKKTKVAYAIAEELKLDNVLVINDRFENLDEPVDYIVSRAVAPTIKLVNYTLPSTTKDTEHWLLKGGDLLEERDDLWAQFPKASWKEYHLNTVFSEPFFETKKVIQLTDIND